ncbi:MAG: 50S ribosomal protein L29 [Planctomycetota bacterium]
MKASEMRELPAVEIETEIKKRHARIFKFRFNSGNEEMQRAGEIRKLRRDIARLKTVQRERELEGSRGKEAGDDGA